MYKLSTIGLNYAKVASSPIKSNSCCINDLRIYVNVTRTIVNEGINSTWNSILYYLYIPSNGINNIKNRWNHCRIKIPTSQNLMIGNCIGLFILIIKCETILFLLSNNIWPAYLTKAINFTSYIINKRVYR